MPTDSRRLKPAQPSDPLDVAAEALERAKRDRDSWVDDEPTHPNLHFEPVIHVHAPQPSQPDVEAKPSGTAAWVKLIVGAVVTALATWWAARK